eukprot:CAMPEP_0115829290 /NCGR_PEP_ID=MMETSP0287-20121206/1022_1 /TAXON_ID=412157 /ORGANISM="Chrysochromulina rotalis, Strain UIO044" /LENGTH=149 /DNA_ID=CAMNT_0003282551 /DNA_START=360 /DNA_END=809 /DNA_ORIENTATION=+
MTASGRRDCARMFSSTRSMRAARCGVDVSMKMTRSLMFVHTCARTLGQPASPAVCLGLGFSCERASTDRGSCVNLTAELDFNRTYKSRRKQSTWLEHKVTICLPSGRKLLPGKMQKRRPHTRVTISNIAAFHLVIGGKLIAVSQVDNGN